MRAPRARREAAARRSSRRRTRSSRSSPRRSATEQKRLRRVEALEELREALNLESLPLRIECFDISNIQGQQIVGSMVVFQDAHAEEGALPQVRACAGSTGQDDFAAMAEVVSRRFARLGGATQQEYDEGFAAGAEPRRDRRRQGAALGRARRDAGATTCRASR